MKTLEQVIADCKEEISDCQIDLDGILELLEEHPERKEAFAHEIGNYKKRMDYNRQLAEWLRELQERREKDKKIGRGNARWLISSDGYYPYCSACMAEPEDGKMTDFCPSCGARMKGKIT